MSQPLLPQRAPSQQPSSAASGSIAGITECISNASAAPRDAGGRVWSFDVVPVSSRSINAAKCREAGADDYFRKPFHFRELLERVQALLGTPGSRRAV